MLTQLISYKRYLACKLVQWRLSSIYLSMRAQVAVGTFFIKSPECDSELWCVVPACVRGGGRWEEPVQISTINGFRIVLC